MNILKKILLLPKHIQGLLMSNPEKNGEYKFLKETCNKLKEESIIFDVGANIGDYSKEIRKINNKSTIYCFEPVPNTFKKLKETHLNTKDIILNNFAFSNEIKEFEMFEYGKHYGTNSIEKHEELISEETKKIKIYLNTIDNFCKQEKIEKIDFLKIDVEGHEVNVLKGARDMIKNKKINIIQLEYNYLWKNTNNTLQEVFETLSNYYNIYRLTFWGRIHLKKFNKKLENYPSASNYVAIRK